MATLLRERFLRLRWKPTNEMSAAELLECEYAIQELRQKGSSRYSEEELLGKLKAVLGTEISRGLIYGLPEYKVFYMLLKAQITGQVR